MAPLFHSKHQKLIDQCYPPGRGFDKKPNSSELSYLLYYASTRRVKLEKVGRYLEKRNRTDIARGKTGNVQVTLELLGALMNKCPDDVNVFAENVNVILSAVVASGDLGLCQHAEPVYRTFCATLPVALLTGDQGFVNNFVKLSASILALGSTQHLANPTEWKAIALKAAASFASSRFLSFNNGKDVLIAAIPLVINEIHRDFSEDTLLKKIVSHNSEQHSLSRFNTAKTTRADDEPATPKEINTDELAIAALKAFFHTSSATQIRTCTRSVSTYLAKSGADRDWASAVTEMLANWIPVQLRFLVLSILIGHLAKDGVQSEQLVYLHIISRLLASSVNLIGLSVIDHLRQLVDLQMHVINSDGQKELSIAYSEAIGSLATHVYYQEQIVDMVGEQLIRLNDYIHKRTKNIKTIIVVLLDNIKSVLLTAHENAAVQRASVPLELLSDTLSLLSYDNKDLSQQDNSIIRGKYTDLLITDLTLEYNNDDFIIPDHNQLISDASVSVINQLYEQIEKCSLLPEGTNYDALLRLIELIAEKFGINAIVNSVPFLFQWQLTEQQDSDRPSVIKDNFGYTILYFASKSLQYGELLDQVLARIDYRKANGLWLVSSVIPLEKSTQPPQLAFTQEEAKSYFQDASLQNYRDTIFITHYRYNNSDAIRDIEVTEADEDVVDSSFMSHNGSLNVSLHNLLQPSAAFHTDTNSIKSAPLSARSLLLQGKLNRPKVQELRKAISGTSLKVNGLNGNFTLNGNGHGNGTEFSRARTDARTMLEDLSLDDNLEDQGALTFRG